MISLVMHQEITYGGWYQGSMAVDFCRNEFMDACAIAKEHDIEVEKKHNSVGHIINLFFEKYYEKMG